MSLIITNCYFKRRISLVGFYIDSAIGCIDVCSTRSSLHRTIPILDGYIRKMVESINLYGEIAMTTINHKRNAHSFHFMSELKTDSLIQSKFIDANVFAIFCLHSILVMVTHIKTVIRLLLYCILINIYLNRLIRVCTGVYGEVRLVKSYEISIIIIIYHLLNLF